MLSTEKNVEILPMLQTGLQEINAHGYILAQAPSDKERQLIQTTIKHSSSSMSFYDFVTQIFDELDVLPIFRADLFETVERIVGEDFDYENVKDLVKFNYQKMHRD